MKESTTLLLCITFLMTLIGCGENKTKESAGDNPKESVDSLLEELSKSVLAMSDNLNSVEDGPSAEAAVTKGIVIADEILGIAQRMEKSPVPNGNEKKRIEESWGQIEKKIMEAVEPPVVMQDQQVVREIMGQGMQRIGGKLEKANAIFEKYGIDLLKNK